LKVTNTYAVACTKHWLAKSPLLIRFSRRGSVWTDDTSVDDLCKIEFRDRSGNPDLNPSVYSLERTELPKAYAEHSIKFEQKFWPVLCLEAPSAGFQLERTPGMPDFKFTCERHREFRLKDTDELSRFALTLRRSTRYEIGKDAIVEYIRKCSKKVDLEWCCVLYRGSRIMKLTGKATLEEFRATFSRIHDTASKE
jgi:hypothetical protein